MINHLAFIEQLVEDIARSLGSWAYLLVGTISYLETAFFVGLIAPGEFTIILGGVLAGQGTISILILIGIVWFAAFAGDTTSFFLGRRLGRDFLIRHGKVFRISPERLTKVEGYFDRHGGKTILVGRFIGLVRALAPFLAGASRMEYRRFLPYDVVGTGLWSTLLLLAGYFFWQSFQEVVKIAGRGTLIFGFLVFFVVVTVVLRRKLKDPKSRRRLEDWYRRHSVRPPLRYLLLLVRPLYLLIRAVVRPLKTVFWPQLRFLIARFRPGGLGLELTTLLAFAAVGTYIVGLYVSLLSSDKGPTPGDTFAFEVVNKIRADWLTDIAKILTYLGRPLPVAVAVVLVALFLVYGRYRIEASVLVLGSILTWSSVHILKAEVTRPRPSAGLVEAVGWGFPSGHAALAVAYLAIAVLLLRVGIGTVRSTLVVTVGLVAAASIGLSRLYLHVHYLSDITVGWALAISIFSLVGIGGLVVGYIEARK